SATKECKFSVRCTSLTGISNMKESPREDSFVWYSNCMNTKPTVSLLMTPGLEDTLFNDTARQELNEYCDVISWSPAQGRPYPDSNILLASWGCPKFDAAFLE